MSKGSKRREEDSAKIADNWDKIFKSHWPIEEAVETYKNVLKDVCYRNYPVIGDNGSFINMLSCPCSKCKVTAA